MNVLLIDDSVDIGYLVRVSLKPYEVFQAFSISEAKSLLEVQQFNLILIDVTLPDGDGFKLCYELSIDTILQGIPKFILTGKSEVEDKVFGLSCGAMDYITKPFFAGELKARVEAHLRGVPLRSRLTEGPFEFDQQFQKCFLVQNEQKLDLQLTPTEFRIFLTLVRNKETVLSREEIVQLVWKANGLHIEPRGVDSHVTHLRKKLGAHGSCIASVYGKGFTYTWGSEQAAA